MTQRPHRVFHFVFEHTRASPSSRATVHATSLQSSNQSNWNTTKVLQHWTSQDSTRKRTTAFEKVLIINNAAEITNLFFPLIPLHSQRWIKYKMEHRSVYKLQNVPRFFADILFHPRGTKQNKLKRERIVWQWWSWWSWLSNNFLSFILSQWFECVHVQIKTLIFFKNKDCFGTMDTASSGGQTPDSGDRESQGSWNFVLNKT